MNICIVSGKLQNRPAIFGDGKALKFTVVTQHRYGSGEDSKEGFSTVPCAVFNPTESLKQFLTSDQVVHVKGVGRINRSRYEDKDGKTVYSTEVVLNPQSVMVRTG